MNRPSWLTHRAGFGLRLALVCIAAFATVGACSSNPGLIGDQDGSSQDTGVGPTCNTPHVGCPCTVPGAQAACGQVVRKSGDYVTCSEGQMTCTGGAWGTCVGDTIYMKSLGSTTLGGLQSEGLQTTPSPCTNDPCDPACTNYVDNGSGLEAGGLTPTDAGGVTLSQADGSQCTGLQCQQVGCSGDAGSTTSISGRVVAGTQAPYGTPDPVPNVLVYVPNAPLQAFAAGVQCNTSCSAEVSGSPIAAVLTNYDGTFTLTNVPVGTNIPVVIQLGRWRREVQFNVTNQCVNTAVGDIHMPRNMTDSTPASSANIPLTAVDTGDVDALECVLLKMGVDQAEFTSSTASPLGRILIYDGNGSNAPGGALNEGVLVGSAAELAKYDQVLFPCWGTEAFKSANDQTRVYNYANAGGRVFATHYSYTWLFQQPTFSTTANWDVNNNSWNSLDGRIDTSFVKGQTLANWMTLLGQLDISNVPPDLTITNPRRDLDSVVSPSQQWIYNPGGSFPLHYTFDTPYNTASTCGRVVYSDFHVANTASGPGVTFPNECPAAPMSEQEKVLEFLLYDLASCGVVPPVIPPYPSPATFTRDYQGVCPVGQAPVWRFFDWETVTPEDSSIAFTAQEANTQAQLTGATPVVNLGTASGAPITTWTGTDVSSLITPSLMFLRVTITMNPSSDHEFAPTLTAWRQQYDCVDAQ